MMIRLLALLLNPVVLLFLAVLWMLKDEKDRTRPFLVFALVLNVIYGWLLNAVLGGADSLLPWKYDYYLLQMDQSLGLSAASVGLPFQGAWRIPLFILIYELLVPMMIFWLLIQPRTGNGRASILLAYISEMVAGPILYAILPACGPLYAFGATWLHHGIPPVNVVRFSGIPNAFPSLHIATAFVFVLFSTGALWRSISLLFLAGTAIATLATGEHYVIDLIPGLAFGCFAASVGRRRARTSLLYLGIVLCWSLGVRFESALLIAHPALVRSFAAITVLLVIRDVWKEWRMPLTPTAGIDEAKAWIVEPDFNPPNVSPYPAFLPVVPLTSQRAALQSGGASHDRGFE